MVEHDTKNAQKVDANKLPIGCLGIVAVIVALSVIKFDPAVTPVWNWLLNPFRTAPEVGAIVRVMLEYLLLATGFSCTVAALLLPRLSFRTIVTVAFKALFDRSP